LCGWLNFIIIYTNSMLQFVSLTANFPCQQLFANREDVLQGTCYSQLYNAVLLL